MGIRGEIMDSANTTPQRRARVWLVGVLAALAAAAVAAVFLYAPTRQIDSSVRVGYLRISPALPFFVAQDQRMFDANGVGVEAVPYTSGLQMLDDVLSGKIDASITGPVDLLLAKEIEAPGRFRIYLQAVYSLESPLYSLVVRADSTIRSTEDLKGKTVAVAPGVTNAALLALALKTRHGYERDKDYQIVQVAPGLQLDTVRSGLYAAVVPLEATGTIAATSSDLRVVEWAPIETTLMSPLPVTAYAVSAAAISAKPETIRSFVRSIEQAVDYVRAHERESRVLLTASANLTPEQASRCGIGQFVTLSGHASARLQEFSDLLTRVGALKQHVDVEPVFYRP